MSKELLNAGGFYVFVLKGLGRPLALVATLIAFIGYNFFVADAVGVMGFFTQAIVAQLTGINFHWYLWSLLAVALAAGARSSRRGRVSSAWSAS